MISRGTFTTTPKVILLLGCAVITPMTLGALPSYADDTMTEAQRIEAEEMKPHAMSENLLERVEVLPEKKESVADEFVVIEKNAIPVKSDEVVVEVIEPVTEVEMPDMEKVSSATVEKAEAKVKQQVVKHVVPDTKPSQKDIGVTKDVEIETEDVTEVDVASEVPSDAHATDPDLVRDMQNQNQQLARALETTRYELVMLQEQHRALSQKLSVVSEQNERLHIDLKHASQGKEALYSVEYQRKLSQRVLDLTSKISALQAQNKSMRAVLAQYEGGNPTEMNPSLVGDRPHGAVDPADKALQDQSHLVLETLRDENSLLASRNRELSSMILTLKQDLERERRTLAVKQELSAPPAVAQGEAVAAQSEVLAKKDKQIAALVERSEKLQERLMDMTDQREAKAVHAQKSSKAMPLSAAEEKVDAAHDDIMSMKKNEMSLMSKVHKLEEENLILQRDLEEMADQIAGSSKSCDERWLAQTGQTNQVMDMQERLFALEKENDRLRSQCKE